jgi:hypothetical protein
LVPAAREKKKHRSFDCHRVVPLFCFDVIADCYKLHRETSLEIISFIFSFAHPPYLFDFVKLCSIKSSFFSALFSPSGLTLKKHHFLFNEEKRISEFCHFPKFDLNQFARNLDRFAANA